LAIRVYGAGRDATPAAFLMDVYNGRWRRQILMAA
jgi:hypothetical protein